MKKVVVLVVVAIVGIGAGAAGGIYMTNAKSKAAIADMQAKMQQSEASSQARIRNYDSIVNRLSSELQLAKTELELLKTPAPTEVPAQEQAVITIPESRNTAAAPADNSITGTTRLYTIQSGDSLWSIAQKQLGNGDRFKEILKLNPNISAKSNLTIGAKLKIPAK